MTYGVSGAYDAEEYFEMDQGWFRSQAFHNMDPDYRGSRQSLIEYGSHELSYRLEDGGWYQFPGYAPIVRRQGSYRQMIVPLFEKGDLRLFGGWYLVVDSEMSDIDQRAGRPSIGDAETFVRMAGPTTDPEGYVKGLFYHYYLTLGEVLDAVDSRSYARELSPIIIEYPEPPHDPNDLHPHLRAKMVDEPDGFYVAWVDYWMRLIP
jgi:hypothetical protein